LLAALLTVASGTVSVNSASAATARANANTVSAVDLAAGPALSPVQDDDIEVALYGWYVSKATCLSTGETVGALDVVVYWYCSYNSSCGLWALILFLDWDLAAGTPVDRSLSSLALSKSGPVSKSDAVSRSGDSPVRPASCGQWP
jgi:hypothetical protein